MRGCTWFVVVVSRAAARDCKRWSQSQTSVLEVGGGCTGSGAGEVKNVTNQTGLEDIPVVPPEPLEASVGPLGSPVRPFTSPTCESLSTDAAPTDPLDSIPEPLGPPMRAATGPPWVPLPANSLPPKPPDPLSEPQALS